MIYLAFSLASLGQIIFTVLGVLIGFGALVFVHELGHFLLAKKVGIRVEAFAFGFGPKIIGVKSGETEYRLNWIPFGGYVKLAGMEGEEGKDPHEIEGGFYAASPGHRSICIVGGALFNIIFAIFLFTILWFTGISLPKQSLSTTIGSFEEGMPGEESSRQENGLRLGDNIVSINGNKIEKWNDVIKAVAFANTDEFTFIVLRDAVEKEIQIRSREDDELGAYRIGIGPASEILVHDVTEGSLAEEIGLKKGDEILRTAGEDVFSLLYFKKILAANIDKEIEIVVLRGDEEVPLKLTVPKPAQFFEIEFVLPLGYTEVKFKYPSEEYREAHKYPILGFRPSPLGKLTTVYRSPAHSVKETINMVYSTLSRLFAFGQRVKVKPKALSGPVGIFNFIRMSMMVSLTYYVWFIAFLSMNLGIVNILPIPVLDGGHIVFAGIERIRKRPLPERIMATITNVFVVLIISFFLYVTWHDVKRTFLPPEHAKRSIEQREDTEDNIQKNKEDEGGNTGEPEPAGEMPQTEPAR